jgi:hypothetical protein
MTANFAPNAAPIVIEAFLTGPRRTARIRLALDTGASGTLVRRSLLVALGYDLTAPTRRRRLRAATGGAVAPVIDIRQLLALGSLRSNYPVAAHELPPVLAYDGFSASISSAASC